MRIAQATFKPLSFARRAKRLTGIASAFSTVAVLWAAQGFAQTKNSARPQVPSNAQLGKVVQDQAAVYRDADFDSPVIGRLKKGTQWKMSKGVYGAFYRVQIRPGLVGYVTDVEIIPLKRALRIEKSDKAANFGAGAGAEAPPELQGGEKRDKGKREFEWSSFRGGSLTLLRYKEETMVLRPQSNMMLLGFKAVGPDVLTEGLPTELNLAMSFQAPSHYEQATGQKADGFLILLDGLVSIASPRGKNTLTYIGFGPMFRMSRFRVAIKVGNETTDYSLNDMALGAKFNVGLAQRFGNFSARLEGQYYWEKQQYMGLAMSGLWEF